ncbi:glycosyl transferase [Ophiocordyceps camponoti-floridani]|uniref:Glycosyl transferase n=1 Tax=Ophiocordyceps camponoti-floridani TaxID=2030778 RepID=A0A8H4VD37_9HYPO|nr:glycosyl transferase [Ophiocordyceps camponoti-floridani]
MASLLRWRQPSWLRWRLLLGITLLVIVDVWMHRRRLAIARPASNLDPSFLLGCQESDFEAAVTEAAAKDGSVARNRGVWCAGDEGYHHMCRFPSDFVYHHSTRRDYKRYWRVNPDITFSCVITYDPFVRMERRRKRHSYTMALWEGEATAPSLSHKLSRYKTERRLFGSALWTAMTGSSFLPWSLRRLWSLLSNPDSHRHDDDRNLCHIWSRTTWASSARMSIVGSFASSLTTAASITSTGVTDKPVHHLAVVMLLRREEVHTSPTGATPTARFSVNPYDPTDESKLEPTVRGRIDGLVAWELACRCNCARSMGSGRCRPICFNRVKRSVM